MHINYFTTSVQVTWPVLGPTLCTEGKAEAHIGVIHSFMEHLPTGEDRLHTMKGSLIKLKIKIWMGEFYNQGVLSVYPEG